jgi:hypothetical protein
MPNTLLIIFGETPCRHANYDFLGYDNVGLISGE